MSYKDNIFTIYDLMEKKGLFRTNPANRDSVDPQTRASLFKGPVQYPKMLYSPKGEYRVTVPAEIIGTPFGAKSVGEQRELVNKIVESPEEEAVLKAMGWLDHPAKSIHAGGGEAPPISSGEQIATLEAQMEELKKQLQDALATKGAERGLSDDAKANNALVGARTAKVA